VSRYLEQRRDAFGVEPICRAVGVPVSTYYARRSRKPSRRALADRGLVLEIYAARDGYRAVYGVRKTWKELQRRGVDVGRDRVARLMRQEGLEGIRRGKKRRTTVPAETALERARDLVQRDFSATRPNEKWVADITYLRTWTGFVYLAFILDCYSRMIVGWQLATHLRTELVMDALEMANGLRQPDAGLIAHTDRGSQYTGQALTCPRKRGNSRSVKVVETYSPIRCRTTAPRTAQWCSSDARVAVERCGVLKEPGGPSRLTAVSVQFRSKWAERHANKSDATHISRRCLDTLHRRGNPSNTDRGLAPSSSTDRSPHVIR
jgi:transposase InsO family protein